MNVADADISIKKNLEHNTIILDNYGSSEAYVMSVVCWVNHFHTNSMNNEG